MSVSPDDRPAEPSADDAADDFAAMFEALDAGELSAATGEPEAPRAPANGAQPNDDAKRKGGKGGGRLRSIEGGRQGAVVLKAKPVERASYDLQRGDHQELASLLIRDLVQEACGGELVFSDGELRQYNHERGIFELVPEERQIALLDRYAGLWVERDKRSLMMQKSTAQGAMWFTAKKRLKTDFFKDAPKGIAFANGFVRVEISGLSVVHHDPGNRARHGYAFPYDPDAKAPRFLAFLDEIFRDDYDREQKIAFLQEFAGAALCGLAPIYGKMLVTVGQGANGKSTFGNILAGIMPEGSVCSVGPHDWRNDYSVAEMRGRILNLLDELPPGDLTDTDRIKAVVTGGQLKARAIFKDPIFFRPSLAHYFATNDLPGVTDQSHGFWRRVLPIAFNRQFNGKDADKTLAKRILADELPGIIAWAVEGAARLLLNDEYTIPASSAKLLAKWRSEADSVALFIHENYAPVQRIADGTSAEPLYQQYRTWARENGYQATGNKVFKQRMEHMGHGRKRTGDGSKYPVRAYGPTEGPPDHDEGSAPPSDPLR